MSSKSSSDESKEKKEDGETVAASFKLLCDKRMQMMVPFIVFRALSLASQTAVFVHFWVSLINATEKKNGAKLGQRLSEDQKNS